MKKLMDRIWGVGGKLATILGVVAGALVELAPYVDLLPKDSRIHYVAAGLVAFGLWYRKIPGTSSAPSVTPFVLLAAGSLLLAAPAHAQEAQPGGLLPSAGACTASGSACLQPAVTVVPYLIDFRSGNVSRDIAFGVGYAIVFPKKLVFGMMPGADFLGGTKTGGGWIAAIMPRLGAFRVGPVVSHNPGVTYAGLGVGAGL